MTKPLTRAILHDAVHQLAARERRFGDILDAYGPPPLWARKPGFATLLLLILEQQVSIASARATFARLQEAAGEKRYRAVDPKQLNKWVLCCGGIERGFGL